MSLDSPTNTSKSLAESRAAAAQIEIFSFCAVFVSRDKAFPLMQMAEKNHTRRSREN